jgi:hypothetical protein
VILYPFCVLDGALANICCPLRVASQCIIQRLAISLVVQDQLLVEMGFGSAMKLVASL